MAYFHVLWFFSSYVQFISSLKDNLNAEVALGTVTNVKEACAWLGYTYLFIRMRLNPLTYGIGWDEVWCIFSYKSISVRLFLYTCILYVYIVIYSWCKCDVMLRSDIAYFLLKSCLTTKIETCGWAFFITLSWFYYFIFI